MNVSIVTTPLLDVAADALVVGLHSEETRLPLPLARLDAAAGGQLRAVLDAEKFQARAGQVTHLHLDKRLKVARLVVVGLGARGECTTETLRRAASAGVRRARDVGARTVAIDLLTDHLAVGARAQAIVEGAILGSYAFNGYRREKTDKTVTDLHVVVTNADQEADATAGARRGETFARVTCFARDLVNGPANHVHPTHLADTAATIAREGRLRIKILSRAACEKMGMGAFLGVAAGSQQPPAFIHLTYAPARARKRVAVIGKGITFDAGGLDLKSADGMLRMKDDMSGAAAVLAMMRGLPQLAPAIEVHGLIAATENMPSGSALRPGDVLRAMSGTTIEVGNTDAEGRLTLADALAYASSRVKPHEVIDLATLTGACVIALGPLCSGLMTNDQALADRLLGAAAAAGERVWQLPLIDEYRDNLKSDVADLNNVAPRGASAGAINAAIFLKEFTAGMPWAHFDIAGTAFSEKDTALGPKGATGVGVRTMLGYLLAEAEQSTRERSREAARPRRRAARR